MAGFGEEVKIKQQEFADQAASEVEEQRLVQIEYDNYTKAINAYNSTGLEIASAPFLVEDTRLALLGLVRVFAANGIRQIRSVRGETKRFLGIRNAIWEFGWPVVRKMYETTEPEGGWSDGYRTITIRQRMIVTPDNLVMSHALPNSKPRGLEDNNNDSLPVLGINYFKQPNFT